MCGVCADVIVSMRSVSSFVVRARDAAFAANTFSVGGSVSDCLTISLINGPVIFHEAWYDSGLFSLTLREPIPPCLIGIEIILLSFSLMSFPNNPCHFWQCPPTLGCTMSTS